MRRYFSRLGMSYFIGAFIIYGIQLLVLAAVRALCPQWLSNMTGYLLLSIIPMYLIGQPAMAFIISRIPAQGIKHSRSMTAGQLLTAFCIGYGILYISNFAGMMITFMIGNIKGSPVQNVLSEVVLKADPVVVFVFTVLCAPVAEEWLFRKLLTDRAVKYGEGIAVLLSGLMFGLFHGNLNQFVYAFTVGLFWAFIYIKTGRLRYTVILHMMMNFMSNAANLLFRGFGGYDELMYVIAELQRNPSASATDLLAVMTDKLGGVMLIGLYSSVALGIALTGIILFFVNLKKFRLAPSEAVQQETRLSAGAKLSAAILNPGMLLFAGFWIIMIVRQLMM